MSENKKTMISLATSIFAMLLGIIINFVLSPYIVQNFGEEANGFTQLANNFVSYATLLTVALNSMAGRFITISYYKGDINRSNRYYSSVIIGNIIIILVLVIPALYCIFKLESFLVIQTVKVLHVKILFAFVFINFFVAQLNSILGIVFYVNNTLYIQNTLNAVRYILNAIGLYLLFTLFTPKIYYVSLIGVILTLITFPCYWLIKRKTLSTVVFKIKYYDKKAITTMISAGIWNTINQCGNLLMTGFDLLLTNLLVGPGPMGVLSVAKTVPNCIVQLAGLVNTTFSPNLTIAYASEDKKRVIASLRYSMKCSSILLSIPIMVMCVFGSTFYSLWIPSLDAKELTILSALSCAAFIPFAGPQTLYNVYTTTNRLKLNSITVVLGGILNIIVVIGLLKYTNLGIFAVAGVSSIISILRNLVITVPYTAKILGLRWYEFYKDVVTSILCCLISAIVCGMARLLFNPNNWLKLVLSAFSAGFIALILVSTIVLSREERSVVLKKIRSKL